ncbi:DinB family protein [Candidatus Leptofilum sp.]|uniref:DinB family protein n=1 Tax=Candidatus Leptofilum sp. TaxID=3241576 RepID=UPI003B5A4507
MVARNGRSSIIYCMTHPLVTQLHFARSEFMRCLEGLSDEDARKRLLPMNCISWMIGHLAVQEQFYWIYFAQGKVVKPKLYELVGYGRPASTPPLADMMEAWQTITAVADDYLATLTTDQLTQHLGDGEKKSRESVGTMLLRNTYHYWFHTGEAHAVRQQLDHDELPQFVGNMKTAVYQPE